MRPSSLMLDCPLSSKLEHLSVFPDLHAGHTFCRAQKLVDTTMGELGVPGPPDVPTRATCGAYLALRAEVIAMLELRKTLQHR